MCKGGGGSVSGKDNKVETVNTCVNSGDIVDGDHGFTLVSLHVNTMLGAMTGMVVVLGIMTCMIVICSGPLQRLWRRMRLCCKTKEGTDRRDGGWSVGAGVAIQDYNHDTMTIM